MCCFQMVDGQTFRITGPSSAAAVLLPFVQLSGKKDERLHGSAASVPLSHLPGWSYTCVHTIPCQIVPDPTKPYPQPSRHTRMVHPLYSTPPHNSSPQLTKIDQNFAHTWISTPLYTSEESTPPTFCLHSPPGAATSCHQCFFIVSFLPGQIFFVFV